LPADWSFAGYASGDTPIPDVPVVGNVRDYGAVGDNRTDDTDAFLRALADPKVVNGALFIPAGVYRITKTLDMRKSVVLRGAGKTRTIIYIPVSLTEVYGNTWSEVRSCRMLTVRLSVLSSERKMFCMRLSVTEVHCNTRPEVKFEGAHWLEDNKLLIVSLCVCWLLAP
jgi:hypothetical protein